MPCREICKQHKAIGFVCGRYTNGQKRCQVCDLFIIWSGLWCPCCGYKLRTKPRNKKYKAQLRESRI